MENLRAAVIGLGFVGRAHLEALRRQGIPVKGLLSSSPGRSAEAARALGLDRGYESLNDLVKDPSVDVVHICTPNHVHFEEAKAALQAGKHVMCEKPLAMDVRQSSALVELAQKHMRVGGVTYNLRFYPLCQEAHAMVQRGVIGVVSTAAVLVVRLGSGIRRVGDCWTEADWSCHDWAARRTRSPAHVSGSRGDLHH